jgi:predicted nucleic acid-binding protein
MVLADTCVWADHFDHADAELRGLLEDGRVLMHPSIIGELALGNLKRRTIVLRDLHALPRVVLASDEEVLSFVARRTLFGRGIGYVDAHLLAAVQLTTGAKLWTRDRRLREAAAELHLDFRTSLKM